MLRRKIIDDHSWLRSSFGRQILRCYEFRVQEVAAMKNIDCKNIYSIIAFIKITGDNFCQNQKVRQGKPVRAQYLIPSDWPSECYV